MVMKQNGKILPGEDGAGAVGEARKRRQLQIRPHEQDPDSQHHDDAELHERAQIIARGEQQPDRQGAGEKSVDDHCERQRSPDSVNRARATRISRDPLSAEDAQPSPARNR